MPSFGSESVNFSHRDFEVESICTSKTLLACKLKCTQPSHFFQLIYSTASGYLCSDFQTGKLLSAFEDLVTRPPPFPSSPCRVIASFSVFLQHLSLCMLCGVTISLGHNVFPARVNFSRLGSCFKAFCVLGIQHKPARAGF